MSERFQLPIALISVQYRLLGGHTRIWGMCILYTIALIICFLVMCRIMIEESATTAADVAQVAAYIIVGVQPLFAILGGSNAVYRALLRDYETKMFESHRLTPMTNVSVVLGYTFGPTLQIMALLMVGTAFGGVMTVMAGASLSMWLFGNLLLISGAVTIWVLVVFSGMRLAKPVSPTPIMVGISILSSSLIIFPGGGLLCGVYSVFLSCWIMSPNNTLSPAAVILVGAVNLIFALFWISAAAAKYRRPDLPAMNATRGLAFFVCWLIIATIGIMVYDQVTVTAMKNFREPELLLSQWVGTMIGSLLVGAFLVNSAVACGIAVRRGAASRGWGDRVPHSLVTFLIALMICVIMSSIGFSLWKKWLSTDDVFNTTAAIRTWGYSLAACMLAMFMLRGWLVMIYARAKKPAKYGTLVVFLLLWAVPIVLDVALASLEVENNLEPQMSWIFACSPAGTIVAVWENMDIDLWPGILVQAAIAGLFSLIAWRYSRLLAFRYNKKMPMSDTTQLAS